MIIVALKCETDDFHTYNNNKNNAFFTRLAMYSCILKTPVLAITVLHVLIHINSHVADMREQNDHKINNELVGTQHDAMSYGYYGAADAVENEDFNFIKDCHANAATVVAPWLAQYD